MGEQITENKTEYLREALRLAELRIEQQKQDDDINQRKSVWLITFCLSTAGYLYASEPEAAVQCFSPVFWKTAAIALGIIFFIAVGFSVAVVNTADWGAQGAQPSYTMHSEFGNNFNKMAALLLEDYEDNIEQNEEILERKRKQFRIAKHLGLGGIACSALLILAKASACAWPNIIAALL